MVAEDDLPQVVYPHVFANPYVIADSEFPWVFDGNARFEDHSSPDVRAENAKENAFEGAGPREPSLEDGDEPTGHARKPRARAKVRVVELVQSRGRHQMFVERRASMSSENSKQSIHKLANSRWPLSFK